MCRRLVSSPPLLGLLRQYSCRDIGHCDFRPAGSAPGNDFCAEPLSVPASEWCLHRSGSAASWRLRAWTLQSSLSAHWATCGVPRWVRVSVALPSRIRSQCRHHGRGYAGHRRRDVARSTRQRAQKAESPHVQRREPKHVRSKGQPRPSPRQNRLPRPALSGRLRPKHGRGGPRVQLPVPVKLPPQAPPARRLPRPAIQPYLATMGVMWRLRSTRRLPRIGPLPRWRARTARRSQIVLTQLRCYSKATRHPLRVRPRLLLLLVRLGAHDRLQRCFVEQASGVYATLSLRRTAPADVPSLEIKYGDCATVHMLAVTSALSHVAVPVSLDVLSRVQPFSDSVGRDPGGSDSFRWQAGILLRYNPHYLWPTFVSFHACRPDCDSLGDTLVAQPSVRCHSAGLVASDPFWSLGHEMWPSLLKLLCSIGSRLSNILSGQALTSTRVASLLHRIDVTLCANVASLLKSGFTVFRDLPWGPPTPLTVAMSKRRSWSTKQRSANRPGKHERAQLTATIRRTAGVKRAARKPHAAEDALTRVPPPPPAPPDRDRHAAPSSTACMSYAVTPQSHKPGFSSSSEPGSDAAQLHLDVLRGRLYSRLLQQQVMPFPTFVTLQPLPCTGGGHIGAHCVAVGGQAPDRTAQHAYTALLLPVASVILCFSLLLWRGLFAPRALAHLHPQALDGIIFLAMWVVSLHRSLSVWSYPICRLAMEGSPFKGDLHLRRWTPRWGSGLLSLDPSRLISDNLSHQVSRRRIGQARQRRTRNSQLQAICLLAMLATGLGWKTHQTIDVTTSRSSQTSLLLSRLFSAYHPCPYMSYLVRQGPYVLRGAVTGRRRPPRRRHHRGYHLRTPASSICEGLIRMGCFISMMRAAGLAAILTASASRLSLLRRPLTHHMHAQTHTLQVQTRHLANDAMIRSSSTYSSTMSGPKSGRHCSSLLSCPRLAAFLLLLWAQLHAVSGVRVGAAASQHAPGVSSQPQLCSNLEGTKIGTHTEHKPNTWHRVRKRAFRRAIARARRSSEGRALYRGRWVVASDDPKDPASQLTAGPSSRPASRIPILCWNCSGLTTLRFEEIKQWLRSQPPKDRPQLVVLQETMWKDCMEWTDDLYAYIHSGSGRNREGGLMAMVSQQLCPAERLRHHSLQAGRLLHVKVPLEPSIEVLAVYQHAWRSDANNAAKEALLAKRLACWQRIQCFAEATAARSQLLILGDFNTPLSLRHPFTGQGLRNQVPRPQQHTLPDSKHSIPDADVFCYILQCCDLQAQNTFRRSGTHCATFRNCSTKAFTQIDFVLTRRTQADDQSRCAQPVRTFPLLPTDGMFHYPVFCTVPRTRTPRTPKTSASLPRVRPDVATLMLQQHPAQGQAFFDLVQTRLRHAHSPACVNDILLSSWHMIFGLASKSAAPTPGPCLSQLWYRRRLASEASTVFARWRHAVQYRAVRKALHVKAIVAKRARLQQLLQDAEHAHGSRNPSALYQVLRRIAPRVRRRRMQLRDENNRLAGPQDEVRLVAKHFAEVFDATSGL